MASSKATSSTQVPRAHHFELVEGMQLQINVTGSSSGRNARIELQLKNCTTTWILHWGYLYRGDINWFIPVDHPSGTTPYMQGAMQTSFRKNGEVYLLIIELWDPNIHAIEFVLKDGSRDRWDICTLTDFATMYGPSSYRMLHLRVRRAKGPRECWQGENSGM